MEHVPSNRDPIRLTRMTRRSFIGFDASALLARNDLDCGIGALAGSNGL